MKLVGLNNHTSYIGLKFITVTMHSEIDIKGDDQGRPSQSSSYKQKQKNKHRKRPGNARGYRHPHIKTNLYLLLFVCSTGLFQEQKEWLVSFLLLFGRSSYIGRMFGRKQVMRLYAEAGCKVKSRKKVNCIAQTPGSESMLSALKANYFVDLRHWNYDPCGRTIHPVGLLVSIPLLKKFLRTSPN